MAKTPIRLQKPKADPHEQVDFDDQDIYALRSLAEGTASAGQQKRAWEFILYKAAGTYDLPYRPGGLEGERATAFACGKMSVGLTMLRVAKAIPKPKPDEQKPTGQQEIKA